MTKNDKIYIDNILTKYGKSVQEMDSNDVIRLTRASIKQKHQYKFDKVFWEYFFENISEMAIHNTIVFFPNWGYNLINEVPELSEKAIETIERRFPRVLNKKIGSWTTDAWYNIFQKKKLSTEFILRHINKLKNYNNIDEQSMILDAIKSNYTHHTLDNKKIVQMYTILWDMPNYRIVNKLTYNGIKVNKTLIGYDTGIKINTIIASSEDFLDLSIRQIEGLLKLNRS